MYKKTFLIIDGDSQCFAMPVYFFLTKEDILHLGSDFSERINIALAEKDAQDMLECYKILILQAAHFKNSGEFIRPDYLIKEFAKLEQFCKFVIFVATDEKESMKFMESILEDTFKGDSK